MIVFQGSLIPCRITDGQNCHALSRVFLSLFLCCIIFSTGFSVLHFKYSKSASSFSIPGSGDDTNLFFMSISPWAFNFFPLLFCVFFNVFTPGQVNIPSFNILLYRVPAFPTTLIQFVHYAVLLVLYCGSRAEVLFCGNLCFLALSCICFCCCFERSPKGFPAPAVS